MMRHASTAALATLVVCAAPSRTAAAGQDEFLAEYEAAELRLVGQYLFGKRIKVNEIAYSKQKRDGSREASTTFEAVSDGRAARVMFVAEDVVNKRRFGGGYMWYGFEAYSFEQDNPSARHKLFSHKSSPRPHASVDDTLHGTYLFTPMSFQGSRRLSTHFATMIDQAARGFGYTFVSADRVRHNGYNAVRVVTTTAAGRSLDQPLRTTAYLDADNHLAFRGFEADGLLDVSSRRVLPIKTTGVLTYADGPDGYPVPKEYKEWYTHPDGRTAPKVEVTWEGFRKYTPTADDFDLERQFGVKRLPPPAGLDGAAFAPPAGRSWWWLYAAAAALAGLTAGLAWYARRRRAA